MIGAAEIRRRARADGVLPKGLEREYLQYAFLHSLAADADGLVLRGGTMLRIAHGHPRYSEDLGFVRLHSRKEAEASLQAALADVVHWGIRARADDPERGKDTTIWQIRFRGPLWGASRSENGIKVEAATTHDHALEPEANILGPKYPDIPAFTMPTQDRRETTAEKVRGLVERDVARDLYDLAHLVAQGHLAPPGLVARKLRWHEGDPPRDVRRHGRVDYERDLRDWIPARARLPWEAAWTKVRPYLETLAPVRLRGGRSDMV